MNYPVLWCLDTLVPPLRALSALEAVFFLISLLMNIHDLL